MDILLFRPSKKAGIFKSSPIMLLRRKKDEYITNSLERGIWSKYACF